MEETETVLAADLVPLQVRQNGADWRPPAVLVHPWLAAAAAWGFQLTGLAESFQVAAFDLRGHGHSGKPPRGYRLDDYADDLDRVIACYGDGQPVNLLGWSLGATLALHYAAHHAGRVAKLVVIAATPRLRAGPGWPHGVDPEALDSLLDGLATDYHQTVGGFIDQHFGPLTTRADTHALLLCHALADLGSGPAMAAAGRAPAGVDLRPLLGRITCPVLVLHGEHDLLIPIQAAQYLAEHLPAATFAAVPGAGHWAPMTHPDDVNAAILAFLRPG